MLFGGALCATLALAPTLFADAAAPEASSRPPLSSAKTVLLLTVAGSAPDRTELASVTSELLARLGVAVTLEPATQISLASLRTRDERDERDGSCLAHGFVDLTQAGHATLYLLDPERDRLLVRELTHGDEDSELLREELAHILETSIEGLLNGARIGEERATVMNALAPPAPPIPTPATRASERPPTHTRIAESPMRVAALYEVGILSSAPVIAHGPEAALLLHFPSAERFGALLSAQYRFPIHASSSPVSARLVGGALRALATLRTPLGQNAQLIGGVGVGVDLLHVESLANAADVTVNEPRWLSIVVLRASLALDLRISTHLSGFAAFACDLDPQHTRYVLGRDSGETSIFEPWLVRPGLIAGILAP